MRQVALFTVAVVVSLVTTKVDPASFDSVQQARRRYEQDSQAAVSGCVGRLKTSANRLVEAYDQAVYQAKLDGDSRRQATLEGERTVIKEALERLEKDGIQDPVAAALALSTSSDIREDLPREGMVAYFGFNEGRGNATLDAVTKAAFPIGGATWSEERSDVGLDFKPDSAVLVRLNIPLASEWTVVLRAKFPFDPGKRQWSSILIARAGEHHAIVSREGELGVFHGEFVGSGASVKNLTGWHTLAIRAFGGKTTFWIDGVLKGTAIAAIPERIDSFGNAPWFHEGSQSCGLIVDGFVAYGRSLLDEQIAALGNKGF